MAQGADCAACGESHSIRPVQLSPATKSYLPAAFVGFVRAIEIERAYAVIILSTLSTVHHHHRHHRHHQLRHLRYHHHHVERFVFRLARSCSTTLRRRSLLAGSRFRL